MFYNNYFLLEKIKNKKISFIVSLYFLWGLAENYVKAILNGFKQRPFWVLLTVSVFKTLILFISVY